MIVVLIVWKCVANFLCNAFSLFCILILSLSHTTKIKSNFIRIKSDNILIKSDFVKIKSVIIQIKSVLIRIVSDNILIECFNGKNCWFQSKLKWKTKNSGRENRTFLRGTILVGLENAKIFCQIIRIKCHFIRIICQFILIICHFIFILSINELQR